MNSTYVHIYDKIINVCATTTTHLLCANIWAGRWWCGFGLCAKKCKAINRHRERELERKRENNVSAAHVFVHKKQLSMSALERIIDFVCAYLAINGTLFFFIHHHMCVKHKPHLCHRKNKCWWFIRFRRKYIYMWCQFIWLLIFQGAAQLFVDDAPFTPFLTRHYFQKCCSRTMINVARVYLCDIVKDEP